MSYLDAHGCYVRVEEKNWMRFDVWMGRIWYAGSFHRTPVVGEKISSTAVLCALHNTWVLGYSYQHLIALRRTVRISELQVMPLYLHLQPILGHLEGRGLRA